jgi:CelD/BcsL family acetyltransferase involved in cellulose biosynthesis
MSSAAHLVQQIVRTKSASVRLVDAASLPQYFSAWEELAKNALEDNVFYEPWMLLPAMDHIRDREDVHFLLVFGPANAHGIEPLWGLFPIEVQSRCLHLPMRTLAFWQHRYCYLTVPLVHQDHADQVIGAFWRWFEDCPLHCRVLDTNYLLGEGAFHAKWADALSGRDLLVLNEHPRGLQRRALNFGSYITKQLSRKRHHALVRAQQRLEELGSLVYREVESIADVGLWIEQFLFLESQGWKGRAATAIACRPRDAEYFRNITCVGFAHNRARLLSLELSGNPIAMKFTLTSNDGGHMLKIAYDENYAKYSPGVILELHDIKDWHEASKINWIDSCACARHPLYDLVSNERRVIRRTLISNGSRSGDLFISTLPVMRYLRHRLAKRPHGGVNT